MVHADERQPALLRPFHDPLDDIREHVVADPIAWIAARLPFSAERADRGGVFGASRAVVRPEQRDTRGNARRFRC